MLATLWSGPVGLATTGWTFVSRRLRVSLGFWLLATISVTALVAPVVLTCAYPVVTGNVNHQIVATVSVFDLSAVVDEDVARSQRMLAYNIWQTGKPVADQFLRNAYAEHGVNSSEHSGAWFLTGDSQGSEMPISGIRVLGGCEAWKTFIEPSRRLDHCTTEFGAGLKQDSVVTQGVTFADCRSDTAMITNSSSCANVGLTTEFGRWSQSSVVCRLWDEFDPESILADNIVRCNATVKPGTALVDGINMTFSQFTYAAPGYNEATSSASSIPVDPIAAIMQSDLRWLRQSVALKTAVVRTGPSREEALAAGMWDGIMAILAGTGIHRDDATFGVLVVLLGIWFVGSLTATITLLRATWTSTLDGYATARMLQHRPVMTSAPELWFAELEQNEELLEPFKRPQWHSEET